MRAWGIVFWLAAGPAQAAGAAHWPASMRGHPPEADLHPAIRALSEEAAAGAQRCEAFAVATMGLWQTLEPIASNDVSWLPEALRLFARYPGASWAQQALDRALLDDLPAAEAPAGYETGICSPSAYAYGVQRMLQHLHYVPGHEALRVQVAALILRKALHDLAQPCPPLVLLAHQELLVALHAQQGHASRRSARLLAAAEAALDEAMVGLGLRDADAAADVAEDARRAGPRRRLTPGPRDELLALEPARKLLLQLVAEESLAHRH